MSKIIYQGSDGFLRIISPVKQIENLIGLAAIAEKDVPSGTPYWIASEDAIPDDRSQRNAWQIDETAGDPDGFGGESNEFTDEQLLQLYNAGVIG